MRAEDVSVIIVNWNSNDLLKRCLEHLSIQTLKPRRVIIVDNGSVPSVPSEYSQYPGIAVTACLLGTNTGFAHANNFIISDTEARYVALLNPDAFPDPGWLGALIEAADMHSDIAAFGSRQLVYSDLRQIDGIGDVYHMSGLVWRDGFLDDFDSSDPEHTCPHEIFSACAGAALYRTEVLREMGGFDEDFFCYVEDVDLGFRLRLAGHKAMYVPDAVVHHVGSATTGGRHSDFAIYHGHRNLVWAYVKNMPGILFWLFLPLHIALNLVIMLIYILKGKGGVILRAKRDALKGLPGVLKKRSLIQKNRRASIADIWAVLDKRLYPSRKTIHPRRTQNSKMR
ncbi:MAG: glycosyltransferase family 2 protein [Gammaproteobacteria bacterium]|nr:glycosyltransferase family 2 protein [Gammaproteobacteria bacterium]